MEGKHYTPISLLDDTTIELIPSMTKLGLYTADITGYLWVKLDIISVSGGDVSVYASMNTNI